MVYCNTRSRVEELGSEGLFVSERYHGEMDDERKAGVLEEFRAGEVRVVVATSALGMGIDIPDIRLIVHMDEPIDLMEYQQESGRAGRDGMVSEAVIVKGNERRCGREDGRDEWMKRYLENEGGECRRVVMSEYFDGDLERVGCEEGEERCDICIRVGDGWQLGREDELRVRVEEEEEEIRVRVEEEEEEMRVRVEEEEEFRVQQRSRAMGKDRYMMSRQGGWIEMERLKEALERWRGVCVVCVARGGAYRHSVSECRSAEGRKVEEERRREQGRIRYEGFSGCYKCGVPQRMCEQWREKEK